MLSGKLRTSLLRVFDTLKQVMRQAIAVCKSCKSVGHQFAGGSFWKGSLVTLCFVLWTTLGTPQAIAQLPSFSTTDNASAPSLSYVQRGNLHIANVRLDGIALFQVAAAAANQQNEELGDRRNVLPIEWRVNEIETRLRKIINSSRELKNLEVETSTLNGLTVIVVKTQDIEQPLMTVTELDLQIDSTSNSIGQIADARASRLKSALIQAYEERQPAYIRKQLSWIVPMASAIGAISMILLRLQNRFKRQWRRLSEVAHELQQAALEAEEQSYAVTPSSEEALQVSPPPHEAGPASEQGTAAQGRMLRRAINSFYYWPRKWLHSLPLLQQRNLNLTVRALLWWGQLTLWLSGSIAALLAFPNTRGLGIWLIGVPVSFTIILLALTIAKKIIDGLVTFWSHRWAERDTLIHSSRQRAALRVPTIDRVFKDISLYTVIAAGFLLFIYSIRAPLALVITGLGVLGFVSQSFIQDWIAGLLILWEDQYTQGDLVQINEVTGIVECFSLRTTQLRTQNGELVTIANSSFNLAKNLTYHWSQVNLGIEVAYDTDLDQAMTVIEEVASKMRYDFRWGRYILEPARILGVDAFGESSITIRLLIKTKPMKHRELGWEYRRRLKQAFDQAGITIPFPQRSIWLETAPQETSEPATPLAP